MNFISPKEFSFLFHCKKKWLINCIFLLSKFWIINLRLSIGWRIRGGLWGRDNLFKLYINKCHGWHYSWLWNAFLRLYNGFTGHLNQPCQANSKLWISAEHGFRMRLWEYPKNSNIHYTLIHGDSLGSLGRTSTVNMYFKHRGSFNNRNLLSPRLYARPRKVQES